MKEINWGKRERERKKKRKEGYGKINRKLEGKNNKTSFQLLQFNDKC